jgi:HK97 family phage major capsid protein
MTTYDELRSTVEALEAEIAELAATPEITAEQDARLDEAIADHEARAAELAKLDERAAKVAAIQAMDTRTRPGAPQFMRKVETPATADLSRMLPGELRSAALKQLDDKVATEHLRDVQLAQVERLIRTNSENLRGHEIAQRLLLTETDAYRNGFMKKTTGRITTPDEDRALAAFEEFRAMSEGTTTAGGFGVPVLIDSTIILTSQGTPNDILAIANVKNITTNIWKGVSSAGVSWSFDAEGVEVSDDAPTIAQPTVTTYMARGFIPYSIEVGMDYPGFAAEMAMLLNEGYSELVAQKTAIGSGSAEPFGIATALNATTSEVTPTTDGSFGAVDVYKVWAALPQRFRANASWLSHTTTQNSIRAFDTAGGGQFSVNLTQERIPSLFGKPYYLNDYLTAFSGTTGQSDYLIVGDFRNFVVAQRAGMTVELVPHLLSTTTNLPNGQRGWFAYARIGSDSVNDNGFRMLANT